MSKSIYSKIDKKEKRVYRKMYRKHRKEMIRLAKEDKDFDWSYLHDLVITKIRHMYEYYSNGDNVYQVDESRLQIVEQLKYVLDLQCELEHLYDNFSSAVIIENTDGSHSICRDEESTKKLLATAERETLLYKEIYSYIGEYIQSWWD